MSNDLASRHKPITDLFPQPKAPGDWDRFQLTKEQLEHFQEKGFVNGIRLLSDEQIDVLRVELAEMTDPRHEGHELFYEYHSNESGDPDSVLFHALGAWRVRPAFHDICLLYTSPSPRDATLSRMPSSA